MMVALAVAAGLALLEWRMTAGNRNRDCNGYGALAGTLRRNNAAPMRYRVLMGWVLLGLAWVVRLVRRRGTTVQAWHYQVIKGLLMWGALAVARQIVGTAGMLALAVLVASTFEFDYWDCYAELLGVGLCVMGSPWAALAGGVIWGLSRETAVLAPGLALLSGGPWCAVAALSGPGAMGAVRLVQGRAVLYCERWMLRSFNVRDLSRVREKEDVGPLLSMGWTVAAVVVAVWGRGRMPAALAATMPVALVWLVAGWTMARARETRVFMPLALWIAAAVR